MPEKNTSPAAANRVLLVKWTGNHIVKEFLDFYETQGCIISFPTACQSTLSSVKQVYSTIPLPISLTH